ncbi:MAG: transcriptional repressor LexA [Thermodesulfobacteriota bacterium]
MQDDLTLKQKAVFDFLRKNLLEKGFPPTLREIASNFGLKGPRAPQKTLQILERKGYIRRVPGGSRTIEILRGRSGALPYESFVGSATVPTTLSVPIIGRVTAGEPILAVENVEGYLNLDRGLISSDDVFLLRVQGDSMIGAHIQDGDFALVKPQPHAENGEIIVALIEDEATIKRIFKKKDFIRLEPANPNMEPIIVKKGEKKISIVGKVVGIFRKL